MRTRQKRTYFFRILASTTLALLCALSADDVRAQTTKGRMTFQRYVDTPSPGASGVVALSKRGGKQTFQVEVKDLPGESFGVFYGNSLDTNSLVFLIATMSRGASNNTWRLKYEAVGGAPSQLPVADLDDFSGLFLFIGKPSALSNFVDVVLFAAAPSLTSPIASFNVKAPLSLPPVPPSPTPKGLVRSQFASAQGRSVFEVRAKGLPGGNEYHVWIADAPGSTNFIDIGALPLSASNSGGIFRRDTKKGETLPFGATTITNLSGRAILITDAFGDTHLLGQIP